MRRYFGAGALVLVTGLVVLVAVLLLDSADDAPPDTGITGLTTTSTNFPYDFVEAIDQVDVETLAGAKFASLTLVTADGLESYLLAADSAGFASVTEALREADENEHRPAAGGPAPGEATGSTIPADGSTAVPGVTVSTLTYVMDDRSTYTLVLDKEQGVIYRGTQEWRPRTDLATLIDTVVSDTAP